MNKTNKRYSPEVRERSVRMVLEHRHEYDSQWAAIESVAGKIGYLHWSASSDSSRELPPFPTRHSLATQP